MTDIVGRPLGVAPTPYSKATALIFLSILILLFNPFVVIDGQTKFTIIGVLVVFSFVFALAAKPSFPIDGWVFLFLAAYAVMIARTNNLSYDPSFSYEKAILQECLCLLLFVVSPIIANRSGIRFYVTAMTTMFGIVCAALFVHYNYLLDPVHNAPVGDFVYDRYQQVSTVFSVVAIVCLMRGLRLREGSALRAILLTIFLVCAPVVLITIARGELIAFIVAITIVLFPRSFVLGAIVAAIMFPIILTLAGPYDIMMVKRFDAAIELGWDEPRVALAIKTISLLANDITVALIGGGANYFQSFYNLTWGWHPHNFVLDAWVSGGLLLAVPALILYVFPIGKAYIRTWNRKPVDREVLAICIFFAISFLKGASITSTWLLPLTLPLFMSLRQSVAAIPIKTFAVPTTPPATQNPALKAPMVISE